MDIKGFKYEKTTCYIEDMDTSRIIMIEHGEVEENHQDMEVFIYSEGELDERIPTILIPVEVIKGGIRLMAEYIMSYEV